MGRAIDDTMVVHVTVIHITIHMTIGTATTGVIATMSTPHMIAGPTVTGAEAPLGGDRTRPVAVDTDETGRNYQRFTAFMRRW